MQPNVVPTTPETKHVSKRGLVALRLITCLVLMVAAGLGVYFWQQNELKQKEQKMQAEVESLKADAALPKLNYYKTQTGGLTLNLPREYAVIVNVDGNKGGAPGATLRVAKVEDGIVFDNSYGWLEIEIDHTGGTLGANASIIKDQLERQGLENAQISDAKFKEQPAKVVTAEGFAYEANRRVYVVTSGEFTYSFISKTHDKTKNDPLLQTVLDGSTIEAKNLNLGS